MPYANAHILIRANGHFGSGASSPVDQWSTGFRFAVVGADVPFSPGNLQTFVDSCAAALKTFQALAGTGIGAECWLTEVTGARIGTDGHYSPLEQETKRNAFAGVGGAGAINAPYSSASVFSLRTGIARGYASNGRIYWPATAPAFQTNTGRMSSTQVTSRLNGFNTLVRAMNTAASAYATNMRLAVMSAVGAGRTMLVTDVRIDSRLDNVERRENKLAPTWQTITVYP